MGKNQKNQKDQKDTEPRDAPPKDKRLGRMVMLSGLLHVGLLLVLVSAVNRPQSTTLMPQTYTVSLVAPAALGLSEPTPAPSPKKIESAVVSPSPKPKPQKPEVEQKKPKREKAAKKKKPNVAKPKKKRAVTIASKKTPPPKKKEPPKTEVKKSQAKKTEKEKKTPQKALSLPEPADQRMSAENRDQQIVAALEKIRQRVKTDVGQAASVQGGSGGGGGDTIRGLPFILYTEQVKRRVKQSWIVAEQKSGLTAVVQFEILANGAVVNVALVERSGSHIFDESTMRAVRKASPLPPPPEAYRDEFARQKVEVVFGEPERFQ